MKRPVRKVPLVNEYGDTIGYAMFDYQGSVPDKVYLKRGYSVEDALNRYDNGAWANVRDVVFRHFYGQPHEVTHR